MDQHLLGHRLYFFFISFLIYDICYDSDVCMCVRPPCYFCVHCPNGFCNKIHAIKCYFIISFTFTYFFIFYFTSFDGHCYRKSIRGENWISSANQSKGWGETDLLKKNELIHSAFGPDSTLYKLEPPEESVKAYKNPKTE